MNDLHQRVNTSAGNSDRRWADSVRRIAAPPPKRLRPESSIGLATVASVFAVLLPKPLRKFALVAAASLLARHLVRGATSTPTVAPPSSAFALGAASVQIPARRVGATTRSPFHTVCPVLKRAGGGFLSDDVLTLSGALTFSTLLSFAPLILLALWVTTALGQGAQDAILNQLQSLIGDDGRKAAQAVIDSADQRPALGSIAGLFGILVSIVGATTVFAQLQTSLNDIWHVKAKATNAVWDWLRHRVLSVGLLASIAFVMAISLVISAGLGAMLSATGVLWDVLNQLITAAVFALLFAGLFRYLPDVRIGVRRALWGGLVTAILFAIGKAVIGLYLAHGSVGGAYGAAGSFVVLLVWVYYSAPFFSSAPS